MSELTETKEMKSAQNDFASTFQAFKTANDERLAALEQKQGDGLLTDKVNPSVSKISLSRPRAR